MNILLLTVALAGPIEAPKPVMLVPPALVTAAVPSVRIAPEGNTAAESAAPEAQLPSGGSVNEAVAQGEVYSNATDAVEWVVPRTVMTQLVIANEGLR